MVEFRNGFVWGALAALFSIMMLGLITILMLNIFFQLEGFQIILSAMVVVILSSVLFEVFLLFYYVLSGNVSSSRDRLSELEIKLKSLEMARKEAQKRYYDGRLEESSFKRIMQSYEKEILEVTNEIMALKNRT